MLLYFTANTVTYCILLYCSDTGELCSTCTVPRDPPQVDIIQILDGGESTIQFTGRRKVIMDEATS